MAQRWTLKVKVRTSLLIGGQTSPVLVDAATARYPSGLPIIPASALKGMLRIEFERLARLAQERHLLHTPPVCDGSDPERTCGRKDPSQRCIACRVFGTPGGEGKLRFHDATLIGNWRRVFVREREEPSKPEQPTGIGYDARPGVAINRRRRVAAERLLFMAEALTPFLPECAFEASVEALEELSPEEERLLRAAAEGLVTGVGGGKSRGMGHIQVSLERSRDVPQPVAPVPLGGEGTHAQGAPSLRVTLIPQEYLRASGVKVRNNFLDSLDFIPGSTLRGAVARSFVGSSCSGGSQSDAFRQAFLKSPTHFSNLYPYGAKPIPLSARTCKAYPGLSYTGGRYDSRGERAQHGARDVLIAATLVKRLRQMGMPAMVEDRCRYCPVDRPSELKELTGYYITPWIQPSWGALSFRMHTKTALNRQRGTSAEGQLYSYALVDVGVEYQEEDRPFFAGWVTNVSPELQAHLLHELHERELFLGGARLRGYGKVKVRVEVGEGEWAEGEDEWREGLGKFTEAIVEPLLGVAKSEAQRSQLESTLFFALTCASDVKLPPGGVRTELENEVSRCLGIKREDLALEKVIARMGWHGGYNEAIGIQKPLMPVIGRGSAFVFSCPKTYESALLHNLPLLLRDGMGLGRQEGFGRVSFCDPFHLDRRDQA